MREGVERGKLKKSRKRKNTRQLQARDIKPYCIVSAVVLVAVVSNGHSDASHSSPVIFSTTRLSWDISPADRRIQSRNHAHEGHPQQ